MTPAAQAPRVVIGLNSVITNDPCAICGKRTDPNGIDFFLEGTRELVCNHCAQEHAPGLYRLAQFAPAVWEEMGMGVYGRLKENTGGWKGMGHGRGTI
jgi:hypothetical protein